MASVEEKKAAKRAEQLRKMRALSNKTLERRERTLVLEKERKTIAALMKKRNVKMATGPTPAVVLSGRQTGLPSGAVVQGPTSLGHAVAMAPDTLTSPVNISDPWANNHIEIRAGNHAIIIAYNKKEDIPIEGDVGVLLFSEGVCYVRTPGGIVNLGTALAGVETEIMTSRQKFDSMNNRRAAIKDQKAKRSV
jgi:hypothetical protein